ncbi:hypothetical protein [Humibacter albus]|uniref:hypothetical protein n=1 Tax=Humibacter albus TaxID=427754 RepID=UPI0003B52C07|nr:hypothetical protein [Humibacter albus]
MAVSATHITLRDLSQDDGLSETQCHESHHGVALLNAWTMIEVEDAKIRGSAIDARMFTQVCCEHCMELADLFPFAGADHFDMFRLIHRVVVSR